MKNKRLSEDLFPKESKLREITLIVKANGDNLFTSDVFEEMRQFEQLLYSVEEYSDTKLSKYNTVSREGEGLVFSFSDVC